MEWDPKTQDEIKTAGVVLATNHMVFLANGFPRPIVYVRPPSLFQEQVA